MTKVKSAERTVVIVGGGFSGALFALKLARARPQDQILLVEKSRRLGRGVAYGACSPDHLLNVPVSRMEVGLTPRFADWIAEREDAGAIGAELIDAFVPRAMFGDYLEAQLKSACAPNAERRLQVIRGEAVALLEGSRPGVRLWDGRELAADVVVLAIGNLPPRPPGSLERIAGDGAVFVADPWAHDAFEELGPEEPVLLIGAGLTSVDVALRLESEGRRGPILAVSRHGLLPHRHRGGGAWSPFLDTASARSPIALTQLLRREAARAEAAGVPWQRVLDAARPSVATIWHGWGLDQRRQFLRHLRPYWDVHRHRMAPRIADRLEALRSSGRLRVEAGRITHVARTTRGAVVTVARRGGGETVFEAARIVNCTGPRTDFDTLGAPLIADLRRRGVLKGDALRLGIESSACALVDTNGEASNQLFALGPLTRPAWWEVVAVPEITAQIDELVARLSANVQPSTPQMLMKTFNDIGAGI